MDRRPSEKTRTHRPAREPQAGNARDADRTQRPAGTRTTRRENRADRRFSGIPPCRRREDVATILELADRGRPEVYWICHEAMKIDLKSAGPDDIVGNFTALVAGVAQSAEHRFCKPTVVSSTLTASSARADRGRRTDDAPDIAADRRDRRRGRAIRTGWIPKRPKGPDCKSGGTAFAGSNPAPPTASDQVGSGTASARRSRHDDGATDTDGRGSTEPRRPTSAGDRSDAERGSSRVATPARV